MHATHEVQRNTGIPAVNTVGWGSHFCQFYRDKSDLVETLVPYFVAGLKDNESCLWITSQPLEAAEARDRMVHAMPDFASYLRKGQIEIRDLRDWYTPGDRFDSDDVMEAWLDRERRALHDGYAGLRLTGNTFWLERSGWSDFMEYERKVNEAFRRCRLLALCTYCLDRCEPEDVIDVVRNHHFTVARRDGRWEMIENASLHAANARALTLESALQSRDEFLAVLAHELRNPLAPIRTAARIVRAASPADERLCYASGVIDRQVSHISRLVDDLLDTARMTRGTISLQKQPVDLRTLVSRAVEICRPLIDARNHTLMISLQAGAAALDADATRLTQALGNLLDNAAKYTAPGGRIEVECQHGVGEACIRVRDNGPGIAPEILPHVFEPFLQGRQSLDRPEGGLGLGLGLVRKLVELHGGRVEVSSEPGRGSEFRMYLPLAAAKPAGAAGAAESVAVPTVARRVLVVDDNIDGATSMATALGISGHETRVAHDGPSALRIAADFMPEILLLDVGLPGMDGYELLRRLREAPGMRGALAVAVTGYGRAEDQQRAVAAGFDAFETKPASLDRIVQLIEGHRPRR